MTQKLIVVVGGQFGSEGKGAVAGYLVARHNAISVRVGGPNAGHTVYDALGREWKLQQIPVGAVTTDGPLIIAQGSEIDPKILYNEIADLDAAGFEVSKRLIVDLNATQLEPAHSDIEMGGAPHGVGGLTQRIGSTGKGVGAARAERIWRRANTFRPAGRASLGMADTADTLAYALRIGRSVLVEGTQGYGLGLHTPFYPYTTSGDCRAIDFLAQAGISPWQVDYSCLEVWVVLRTYPIRVAGNSGPMYRETTWEEIGQPPEHTTVTKKQRRVAHWDPALAAQALRANGAAPYSLQSPVRVALTFLDYDFPGLRDCSDPDVIRREAGTYLRRRETAIGHSIDLVSTGPHTLVPMEEL